MGCHLCLLVPRRKTLLRGRSESFFLYPPLLTLQSTEIEREIVIELCVNDSGTTDRNPTRFSVFLFTTRQRRDPLLRVSSLCRTTTSCPSWSSTSVSVLFHGLSGPSGFFIRLRVRGATYLTQGKTTTPDLLASTDRDLPTLRPSRKSFKPWGPESRSRTVGYYGVVRVWLSSPVHHPTLFSTLNLNLLFPNFNGESSTYWNQYGKDLLKKWRFYPYCHGLSLESLTFLIHSITCLP